MYENDSTYAKTCPPVNRKNSEIIVAVKKYSLIPLKRSLYPKLNSTTASHGCCDIDVNGMPLAIRVCDKSVVKDHRVSFVLDRNKRKIY